MIDILISFDWFGDDEIISTKNVPNHFFCTKKHESTPLTVGFSCSFFFFWFLFRPADAPLSSEPGGGQGNLATHTMAQDCVFVLFSL